MKRLLVVFALSLSGCGLVLDDAGFVKPQAADYYKARGFEVLGYQGYNIWISGRCYWYSLKRGDTVYESCLMEWGGELHEYSLQAIDAVKGTAG